MMFASGAAPRFSTMIRFPGCTAFRYSLCSGMFASNLLNGYLVSVVIFIVSQLLSFAGPHYSTSPAEINHFRSNRPVSVRNLQPFAEIISVQEISFIFLAQIRLEILQKSCPRRNNHGQTLGL
jgi:hypothetical protein